jgi:hypothetical protein
MADLYGAAVAGTSINVDANARTLVGDGALGAGPYTSFGTRKLQAINVVSATIDFSSTSNYVDGGGVPIVNGAFAKAVNALAERAEVYYVGIPGNTATGFTALISSVNSDAGDNYGATSTADNSYDNLEDIVGAAVGTSGADVTISNITLSGKSFS